jgi:hypothetical protein
MRTLFALVAMLILGVFMMGHSPSHLDDRAATAKSVTAVFNQSAPRHMIGSALALRYPNQTPMQSCKIAGSPCAQGKECCSGICDGGSAQFYCR